MLRKNYCDNMSEIWKMSSNSGALYAKLTLTSYPNKLLDNNDDHQWRLHVNKKYITD